ncbi:MAG: hypothetical protein AW09_000111 [Candidatus Accumulibacter phosphatis]|uniref:Uncharacterized protein n=1 Tax=Candidatus Accumulibacter phosphatis TaxID=327160 RepID=A0A080M002_9PROT|nr:MAG: hypothetical protein AW09_000111 [Candidatus Accumulibacter phosphatis]
MLADRRADGMGYAGVIHRGANEGQMGPNAITLGRLDGFEMQTVMESEAHPALQADDARIADGEPG